VLRRRVVWLLVLIAIVDTPCKAFDLVEPLSPGGETIFTISVANPTGSNVASVSFESSPIVAPGAYVLESQSSPTCEIQNGVLDEHVPVVLSIAPLPARSTVHCSLRMRRSPTSDGPAGLGFEPSASTPTGISLSAFDWVFGPVVDLSLHVEQIPPLLMIGERISFVRVSVHNTGPWYIDQVNFGYCQDLVLAPFEPDNALPDGCADAGYSPRAGMLVSLPSSSASWGLRQARQSPAFSGRPLMSLSPNPFDSAYPWSMMCMSKETSSCTTSITGTMTRFWRSHRLVASRCRLPYPYRLRLL
jgi:hypothetical protein